MRFLIFLAALSILGMPSVVHACSVTPNYEQPNNLGLVDQADVVLVGRVTGGGGKVRESYITVEPLEAIKGELPGGPFSLEGIRLADSMPLAIKISDPYELDAPHPETMSGSCSRYSFQSGRTVLFMLTRADDNSLHPYDPPFTRWAEDVPDNAPWTRAVRIYAEATALPKKQRNAFLMQERDRLAAAAHDPDALLIAIDIDRQLPKRLQIMEKLTDAAIEESMAELPSCENVIGDSDSPCAEEATLDLLDADK